MLIKEKLRIKELTVEDLLSVHQEYKNNFAEWRLVQAVFDGIRAILANNLIKKHEREPMLSWERRREELFSLEYSKSIVEIFQFYLFKKNADRVLGDLNEDLLWQMFLKDADLYGNDFDAVMMEISKQASILGHMGILVDKSTKKFTSKQEQINNEVYPYISIYYPQAILDWAWNKDENGRPYLSYLKLVDDSGQYRIWTDEEWSIWELPKDKNGNPVKNNLSEKAVFISEGVNELEVIPFLWFYNYKSRELGIGKGDIHGVSRIDLSIIRNLSQADEVVNFAAFPMMRKPMRDAKPTDINAPQQDDEVSVQQVLEFDPENPDSKPDWLSPEVSEAVESILHIVEKKISEIYRAANIGGMAATEPTRNAQSGVAKRIDFNLLNSKIVSKAINLEDAENRILEYYLRWEGEWEKHKNIVSIKRKRNFDIEDLAATLDNALTSKALIVSRTFNVLLQKSVARHILPSATEKDFAEIDNEIDANTKEPYDFGSNLELDTEDEEPKDEEFKKEEVKIGKVEKKKPPQEILDTIK